MCVHVWQYLAEFFVRMRNLSDISCRESHSTLSMGNNFFPRKSCLLWDNVEKFDMAREDLACWINKATTANVVAWTRLNVTLYIHCLSCFVLLVPYIVLYIMTSDLGKLPICQRGQARDGRTGHDSYPLRGWEAEDLLLRTGICLSWVATCCAFVYRVTLECRGTILLYYSSREYAIKSLITVNISPVCAVKT